MGMSFLFSFAFCFPSFTDICKASPDSHFAFLHFFFLGIVLIPVSCTVSQTSIHSSSGTLFNRSSPLNFFSLPLYSHGIWFRSYLNGLVVFSTFFNFSMNLAIRSSWSKPQSAPRQHIEKQKHHFAKKGQIVKAVVFPVVTYRCESWTIKKAEHQRADAFKLWCWRRLLRVPWTARRSNQSILKESNSDYSLEGLMLKLKLQYFGHLMGRATGKDSVAGKG